jgi:hypothetical protein
MQRPSVGSLDTHRTLITLRTGARTVKSQRATRCFEPRPGPGSARDGSQWRVVSIDTAPPLLAEEGFEATWLVEPWTQGAPRGHRTSWPTRVTHAAMRFRIVMRLAMGPPGFEPGANRL